MVKQFALARQDIRAVLRTVDLSVWLALNALKIELAQTKSAVILALELVVKAQTAKL